MTEKSFAEVIESSLLGWRAQTWQWNDFPTFGSLLAVEQKGKILFGIVHQIQTGSIDPIRHPFTYQKTEEQLLVEQPQIFEFLKTTFSCLMVGYREKNKIIYQLAPEPPKIHAFVETTSKQLSQEFFSKPDYLYVLFGLSAQLFNVDELLLAIIKRLFEYQSTSREQLEKFINTFSLLSGNDYKRIKLFLNRVQLLHTQVLQKPISDTYGVE